MKELKEARMGIITVLALMLVSIKRRLPTRRLSSGITTLALAGIVLLVAAGSVSAEFACVANDASGDAYFCGDTVMKSCTLNGSMTCTDGTTYGLIVGASDITIDGAGFNITGAISGSVCEVGITGSDTGEQNPAKHSGIISQFDNVVIKNIEIKNFCGGIGIGDSAHNDVENNMVIGCNIHECGDSMYDTQGIHMVHTSNCSITKNDIHSIDGSGISAGCSGGGNGIFMYGKESTARGWYNNFTCNNLHNNVKSGFFMKHQCMHNTISYNNASYNDQAGIMPKCDKSNHNTFEYNTMIGNTVYGFFTNGDNNTIRYNTIKSDTGKGLVLGQNAGAVVGANSVTHNCICNNGQDIVDSSSANTGDENTCDNGPSGWCDWSCGNEVAVYYDFDKDGQCSKKWDDCQCALPGIGSKCACCNPGLFDGSSAATTAYENSCNRDCQWTSGPDPNDCDFDIKGIVKPDLIVANKSEAWFNETHYYVSYRVQNIGNATSNESEACVYINTAHQAGSDETIGELASGAYSPVKTVGPFGPCAVPKDTIKVCADCDANNTEWNETNNCLENEWFGNQPDLTIVNKTETWFDQGAGIYNITYCVQNIGTAAAPTSMTRVKIDGGSTGTPGVVPSLAIGEVFCETLPYGITMSDSSDTIELKADGPNNIAESDETNNVLSNVFSSAPKISVVAPGPCVDPGLFYVNINVTPNGNFIYGVQYKLTYNKDVIRLQMQNKGPFLERDGNATMVTNNVIDNINGVATYAITRKDTTVGIDDPEGTFVVLTFTTVGGAGETSILNLSEIVISDPQALPIDSPVLINDSVEICAANQAPTAVAKSNHKYNNVGTMYACSATLNGSESSDPDNGIADWAWAFDDGQFGIGEIVGHVYSSYQWTGTAYTPFTATLTVTDNGGLSDNDDCIVNVSIAGDANYDGTVNVLDASMTGLRWNKVCADYSGVCWGAGVMADKADLNNDCIVNVLDTSIVGLCWGNDA